MVILLYLGKPICSGVENARFKQTVPHEVKSDLKIIFY